MEWATRPTPKQSFLSSRQAKPEIVALAPELRAFVRALASDVGRADRLVEETIVRAMGSLSRLPADTDMRIWLFKILRKTFYGRPQTYDRVGDAEQLSNGRSNECKKFGVMFRRLRVEDREVLTLIGGACCSYEAAATICDRSIAGTRRRVTGAYLRLARLMGVEATVRSPDPSRVQQARPLWIWRTAN